MSIFLAATVVALLTSAALAAAASASPAWRFNGTELTGSETIAGAAVLSNITVPGLLTSCKEMHYEMAISNSAGTGQGEPKALTFSTCFTNSKACTVKTIKAEKLPWTAHLITVSASDYVVIEGVRISILYAGAECALGGLVVAVTGSVAGLYDDTSETFAFSSSSSEAAKTTLKALGTTVVWNGVFTTAATGAHSGEALTVS
jgi:hypothetical protein